MRAYAIIAKCAHTHSGTMADGVNRVAGKRGVGARKIGGRVARGGFDSHPYPLQPLNSEAGGKERIKGKARMQG